MFFCCGSKTEGRSFLGKKLAFPQLEIPIPSRNKSEEEEVCGDVQLHVFFTTHHKILEFLHDGGLYFEYFCLSWNIMQDETEQDTAKSPV